MAVEPMRGSPPDREELVISTFGRFNAELIKSMESVARVAEKGPSYVLLGAGVCMIIVSLFF